MVLNNNYIPIGVISSRTAFKNVYTEAVDLVATYENVTFKSPHAEWPVPSIIRSKKYIDLPFKRAVLTKRNVFKRDNYTCVYCGNMGTDKTLTWDHIIPKSRRGKNTWENLATACFKCNNEKDNLTLDELGWAAPVAFHPHYLVVMNSFVRNTPEEWKPYLMVGT